MYEGHTDDKVFTVAASKPNMIQVMASKGFTAPLAIASSTQFR